MELTPEMKAQFTPEQLEKLSISEEAYYADMDSAMDSLTKPNSFMQEQFTPEQLEELSIKEEAYFADQELAEISTQKQRTPAQIKQAVFARARGTAEADAARRTSAKTPAEARLELIEELKRISKKRYDDMTKEEDLIYNSSDTLTVRFREQIKEIRAGKRTDIDVEKLTPIFEGRVEDYDITIADDHLTIAPKNKSTLKVGKTVPQKTTQTQTQAQINLETAKANLEAAKARGMALGPADEAAEYAEKKAAGYFDNDYFNDLNDDYFENLKLNEAGYADDIIEESFDALNHSSGTIASSNINNLTGPATASIVKSSGTRANPLLSSAVSKGGPLNLRNAALAATLGLGVGYANSRRNTRR